MRFLLKICLLVIPCVSFNTEAACSFTSGAKVLSATININQNLSIPRDTPNNTTLFESPIQTVTGSNNFECTTISPWGIKNNLGTDSSTSKIFPISDTGLAWQWIYGEMVVPAVNGSPNTIEANKTYTFDNTRHTLRLLKIGPIKNNAKIPAGEVGYMKIGALTTVIMRLSQEVKAVAQSCETPDVKVDMGEHDLGVFTESGASSKPTSFSIRLNNCPTGINKVMYSLEPTPTTPAWNAGLGIIELNKSSTAKGFALQIMDNNQTPLALNKKHLFSDYATTGGNFTIPLSARYYRTVPASTGGKDDPGVTPGTANTEVTFVMSYL
ncbi:Type-1 fimbrial protein, A chain precursor [compost metagenome]